MEIKKLRNIRIPSKSRNEKMKGEFDETGQYEHHTDQLPTQPLVNPKNVCFIDRSMSFFKMIMMRV